VIPKVRKFDQPDDLPTFISSSSGVERRRKKKGGGERAV